MTTKREEYEDEAIKALETITGPLALAMERLHMNVDSLSPKAARCASKILHVHTGGNQWDHMAFEATQNALDRHLSKHIAKTAEGFEINVHADQNGTWYAELWAANAEMPAGMTILRRDGLTWAEAMAAGRVLSDFLDLRGDRCELNHTSPPKLPDDCDELPF